MRFIPKTDVKPGSRKQRIAVVGAGPAGLYAAGGLVSLGYRVDVFDRLPEPGGLLVSAIPDSRMDKAIIKEALKDLKKAPVEFHLNTEIGVDIDIKDLIEDYDAVVMATGAWKSKRLSIPGADLEGVFSALDFLIDYILAKHGYFRPAVSLQDSNVLVIGGGLTAVDACLVAKESGAGKIIWYYRRRIQDAPGWQTNRAEFESVIPHVSFRPLVQPVAFLGGEKGVETVRAVKMRAGELDDSGRPRPVPAKGSEFEENVDRVLVAAGETPSPPAGIEDCGISVNEKWCLRETVLKWPGAAAIPCKKELSASGRSPFSFSKEAVLYSEGAKIPSGTVAVDKDFKTAREGVFAIGSLIDGPGQAGYAAVEGMMVSHYVHEYLETGSWDTRTASEDPERWKVPLFS